MKVLVTGGAGFIGSHLVDALIKSGQRVVVVDNLSTGKKKFINRRAKFYRLAVESPKIKDVFRREKPEIVYHLAAQKSVGFSVVQPLFDAQVNIIGSLNILENCRVAGVKKIIFISTGGAIYGNMTEKPFRENDRENPGSPYAISKLTIDTYLRNFYSPVYQVPFVSLRLSNVFGPRQDPSGEAGVIAIFINRLLKKQPCFINGSGRQTRDFIYVKDVVLACQKAAGQGSGIYNIGTAKEISINKLYRLIAGAIKGSIKKPGYRQAVAGEVRRSVLNSSKAKKAFNWRPRYTLEQGIEETIEYFMGNN